MTKTITHHCWSGSNTTMGIGSKTAITKTQYKTSKLRRRCHLLLPILGIKLSKNVNKPNTMARSTVRISRITVINAPVNSEINNWYQVNGWAQHWNFHVKDLQKKIFADANVNPTAKFWFLLVWIVPRWGLLTVEKELCLLKQHVYQEHYTKECTRAKGHESTDEIQRKIAQVRKTNAG